MFESASPLGKVAHAAPAQKKRFIGCFFGSGAPMPGGANGDWGYAGRKGGALKAIADHGLQGNVSILRGYRAVNNFDVHWSGTAGFLSQNEVGTTGAANPTSDPNYQKCGRSFDQFIADMHAAPRLRRIEVGHNIVPSWDSGHDNRGSINYVNAIAWRDPLTPLAPTINAMQMFTRVFGDESAQASAQAQYLLKRKKSILDGVLDQ